MVRRVDPLDDALVWCSNCSGYARWRLGPKLMNRCNPQKIDTKVDGKVFTNIFQVEEGEVPDRNAKGWKV